MPYSNCDFEFNLTTKNIISNFEHFKKYEYIYVQEWLEYDSNDIQERAAYYKIPVLGIEGKYRVEYRSSFDPIFEIKRDNK